MVTRARLIVNFIVLDLPFLYIYFGIGKKPSPFGNSASNNHKVSTYNNRCARKINGMTT